MIKKICNYIKKKIRWVLIGLGIISIAVASQFIGAEAGEFDVKWELINDNPTEKTWQVSIENPNDLSINQPVSIIVASTTVALDSTNVLIKRIVPEEYFVKVPIMEEQATTTIITNYKSAITTDEYLIIETNNENVIDNEKYFKLNKIISHSAISLNYQIEHYISVKIGEKDEKRIRNNWEEFKRTEFTQTKELLETDYSTLTLPTKGEKFVWQITIKNLLLENDRFGNSGKIALMINGIEYHPWWNSSWDYRRKVTFNNATSSSNLVNFPVLVSLHNEPNNIDYSNTQDAGEDIRFVNYDGTALDYEIEKWDEAATSTLWIEIPSIEGSTTTQYFYMYYGNTGASDNASSTAVWNSNYMLVQHLQEGDSTDANYYKDSTTYYNNGTLVDADGDSVAATGQIDGAFDFEGDADEINIADDNSLNFTTVDFYVSFWINPSITLDSSSGRNDILVKRNAYWFLYDWQDGQLSWLVGQGAEHLDYTTTFTAGNWYHIAGSTEDNLNTHLYINGVEVGTPVTQNSHSATSTYDFTLANSDGNSNFYNGIIDEVRVMDMDPSSDWIAAQYESMTDDFVSYGSEESAPVDGEAELEYIKEFIEYK